MLLLGVILIASGSLYAQSNDPYADDAYTTRAHAKREYLKQEKDWEEARARAYTNTNEDQVYPFANNDELDAYNRRKAGKSDSVRRPSRDRQLKQRGSSRPGLYSRRLSRFHNPDVRVRNVDEVNIYVSECDRYDYESGYYDDGDSYINIHVGASWGSCYDPWWPGFDRPVWYGSWWGYHRPFWHVGWRWGWDYYGWGGVYSPWGPYHAGWWSAYPYPDSWYYSGYYHGYYHGYNRYRQDNYGHGARSNSYYQNRDRYNGSRSTYEGGRSRSIFNDRGNRNTGRSRYEYNGNRYDSPSRSTYNSDRRYDSPSRSTYNSNRRYDSPSRSTYNSSNSQYDSPSRSTYSSGESYSSPSRSSSSSSSSRSTYTRSR